MNKCINLYDSVGCRSVPQLIGRLRKAKYLLSWAMRWITYYRRFKSFGISSVMEKPLRICGGKRIEIGERCSILDGLRIEAVIHWQNHPLNPYIRIGNGTSIEQGCHIIAADHLEIGTDCVISAFVYISDCSHQYRHDKPIMAQSLIIKQTRIGNNVFIGIGSRIMPGVTVGDYAVIGANAVVTHDVPSCAIVAGVPAKVIGWNNQ